VTYSPAFAWAYDVPSSQIAFADVNIVKDKSVLTSILNPNTMKAHARMEAAFENYFALSDVLRTDCEVLCEANLDRIEWRRNFIRTAVPLIEGYCSCYRDICAIALTCEAPKITKKERMVLEREDVFSSSERYKYTLRAAYKLFGLESAPDFGGTDWKNAKAAIEKRNRLMHPKRPGDLQIEESEWDEIYKGVVWALGQLFGCIEKLAKKPGIHT
jgi:hypothetical protein